MRENVNANGFAASDSGVLAIGFTGEQRAFGQERAPADGRRAKFGVQCI
jgi:hypothetical protein